MKKIFLLTAFAGFFLVAFTGCEKLLDKVGITIATDYVYLDFTINPDTAGVYSEAIKIVESDLDSLIEANEQEIGELNSVKIKDAWVEVTGEGNLDPFSSFVMTIESPDAEEITVAEVTSVALGLNEIRLTNNKVELSDYLKSDQYTVKVKTVLDQDLEMHMNMQARVRFDVKVGL